MKKLIALLLVAVMCLPLTACSNENITQNQTTETIEITIDITQNQTTETIEITIDNWQEYFEIEFKVDFVTNPFGEIDSVMAGNCIVIKPEYYELLLTAEVHFDLKAQNGSSRTYKYDLSSMTYCTEPSIGASASTSFGSSICTYKYNANNDPNYIMIEIESPVGIDHSRHKVQMLDTVVTWIGMEWENIAVDKVIGSITLTDQ